MTFYYDIDNRGAAGRRTAERLLALRAQLDAEIPERSLSSTLLLATWNIREFDSPAYGERLDEDFYYIAEIVSRFDLVAIQEVREDLKALDRLQEILGGWWKCLVTDVTEGSPGNRERMAFLYDGRKVRFGGLAGEVVVPPIEEKKKGKKTVYRPSEQLARTPYLVGFKAGWFRFMLCTTHILFGEQEAEDPRREQEIRLLAEFLAKRAKGSSAWSRNIILLGDFNIFSRSDTTFSAITDAGFVIPEALQSLPQTNTGKDVRFYDQIAFLTEKKSHMRLLDAGVFNYYKTLFRDSETAGRDDLAVYFKDLQAVYDSKKRKKKYAEISDRARQTYYRTYWRTHQMSDHLPMWVTLKIDFGEEYLKAKSLPPN